MVRRNGCPATASAGNLDFVCGPGQLERHELTVRHREPGAAGDRLGDRVVPSHLDGDGANAVLCADRADGGQGRLAETGVAIRRPYEETLKHRGRAAAAISPTGQMAECS